MSIVPTIPALQSLRRQKERTDRHRRAAERIVTAMRKNGLSLFLSYERARDTWVLSDGTRVPPEIAAHVIRNGNIAPVGDALFKGVRGQTYRVVVS
jgi:hypothetical protein